MSAQERIERGDALFALLNALRGEDFGASPECAETDPELFFPVTENATHQIQTAKNICRRCPVQGTCLELALRRGEHGIWGGTTENERTRMRRERRRAERVAAQVPETAGDEVAEAAERALVEVERATGGPVPTLRRRVADALDRALSRGDDAEQRAEAVLVILRPVLADLGVEGAGGFEGVAA